MQDNYQSSKRLTLQKSRSTGKQKDISIHRYNNPRRNQALCFYRRHTLIQIKQGQVTDLSNEIDIDYYHLDDFKLQRDQKVYLLECRQMYIWIPAVVATDMDELCYIRSLNDNSFQNWEATDKGRIFVEGVWETSHFCRELLRFEEIFRQ